MLKTQFLSNKVLEVVKSLLEACDYIYYCVNKKKYKQVEIITTEMINMMRILSPVTNRIKEEVSFTSAPVGCENIIYSLNTILKLVKTRSDRISCKIEFELIPILQDFYYDLYFFTQVFGDREKEERHYKYDFNSMVGNRYIDKGMKDDDYKYEISIVVFAYNKLEYTKQCVESILKCTPSCINYELVLIDNGSDDGTYEYFESLSPTKLFKLKKNSLNIMTGAASRIYEGKYQLVISNDVIVTENYLENLVKCIESDPKIAMVVPTTPNVSNFQSIPSNYSTLEEMHSFAKSNNVCDPNRWEERTRLCNPITLCRGDVFFSSKGVGAIDKYFVYGEFADDALALRLRRSSYKMILAKDCYCYHFGSVTLKEARVKESTLEKSRELFINRYGVDAWSTGFCYDKHLIDTMPIKSKGNVNILGINVGFGSNPLKIKTLHKEMGNQDVELFFVTDDERYLLDVRAYSDNVEYVCDVEADVFKEILFDYILLEDNVEKIISTNSDFYKIKSRVKKGGKLAICAKKDKEIEVLKKLNADERIEGYNCYWFTWRL